MRSLFCILTIFIFISSCQLKKERIIEGDLYFKLLDVERFFDAPDSTLLSIENLVKDISNNPDKDEKFSHFKFMVENNLLRKQFIWIRLDNGNNKILFIDSLDYDKFEQYRWSTLSQNNEKIRIKVNATEFEYPYYFEDTKTAYNCVKILNISKIGGRTYWTK